MPVIKIERREKFHPPNLKEKVPGLLAFSLYPYRLRMDPGQLK